RAYNDWKEGRWSSNPYVDFHIPTQIDPTMAPPGKHYATVFVQYAPYELADGPCDDAKREAFAATVIGKITRHVPDFPDLIVHKEVRTPAESAGGVGLAEGNIVQGELTSDQWRFKRPVPGYAQNRAPIRGLYMCASSSHPGGGVMGAPGANAAREVLRDLGRRIDTGAAA